MWKVKKSKVHGTGVFAIENIKKGTLIIEYIGEKVTKKEGDLRSEKRIKKYLLKLSAIPLHPHNATVQLWLELGLVGVALYFFLLVSLVNKISTYSKINFNLTCWCYLDKNIQNIPNQNMVWKLRDGRIYRTLFVHSFPTFYQLQMHRFQLVRPGR